MFLTCLCTLFLLQAIPAWFVTEHGDKFRQFVLLWSGLSSKPWRVKLYLSCRPPCSRPEVQITGGWKAFATANGLLVGDLLIFCLRAMSEFDVYILHEIKSLDQPTSIEDARKQSCASELSEEKVKTSAVGCRDRDLVHGRSERLTAEITMEKGQVGTENRVNETLRDRKGKISFQKTLRPGAVSARFQLVFFNCLIPKPNCCTLKLGSHSGFQS